MNLKRPWIAAGATLAIAGFGGALAAATSSAVILNDRQQAPAVQLVAGEPVPAQGDSSPESADSPAESPFESANSGADSPRDDGSAASPASADTADGPDSPDSPGSAGSADSPG